MKANVLNGILNFLPVEFLSLSVFYSHFQSFKQTFSDIYINNFITFSIDLQRFISVMLVMYCF